MSNVKIVYKLKAKKQNVKLVPVAMGMKSSVIMRLKMTEVKPNNKIHVIFIEFLKVEKKINFI